MSNTGLQFGYNPGLPDGVEAAWGARLIVTQDGSTDLLWDRQDLFASDDARKERLIDWLNGNPEINGWKRGHGAIQKARDEASRLLKAYAMRTSEAGEFVLFDDGTGRIIGNTNASYGYLYVVAYLRADLPDGKDAA